MNQNEKKPEKKLILKKETVQALATAPQPSNAAKVSVHPRCTL